MTMPLVFMIAASLLTGPKTSKQLAAACGVHELAVDIELDDLIKDGLVVNVGTIEDPLWSPADMVHASTAS